MAAVKALASINDFFYGAVSGVAKATPQIQENGEIAETRTKSSGSKGGNNSGKGTDLKSTVSTKAVQLFSAAVLRVVHLHDDPRPFVGVCLTFAADSSAGVTAAPVGLGGDSGTGRGYREGIPAARAIEGAF